MLTFTSVLNCLSIRDIGTAAGSFEQAETEGVTVDQAIDKRGRANPRRIMGWTAYSAACREIEGIFEGLRKQDQRQSPIGWDFTPMEQRNAA